jgi:nuclear cap-binding protein subunit 1
MEKKASGALSEEDAQLIQEWGRRWHQTFLRKAQVEESVVGEQAVEARVKLLAAEPDTEGADGEASNGEAQMSIA